MGKGKINISISGGNNEFGNIVQGRKNTISNTTTKALEDFYGAIKKLQVESEVNKETVENLMEEIDTLSKAEKGASIAHKLESMYERYSWAIVPLKKLFSVIF